MQIAPIIADFEFIAEVENLVTLCSEMLFYVSLRAGETIIKESTVVVELFES